MESTAFSSDVRDLIPELTELRRRFHRYPELAFKEEQTAGQVAEYLRQVGLPVQTGIAGTGVVALLEGAKPGPTILLRADMDALPIQEANEVDYRSTCPGIMHACGHDGHTAILLVTARVLAQRREYLSGNVKFVFQPAEENPGGALPMIEKGVLENPKVDAALALHLAMMLPVGSVGVRPGPVFASTDEFSITVLGKGGHGGMPHETVDPVVCAARLVQALQTLVSRECNPQIPLVVTVGKICGGQTFNVVPDRVEIGGTVRTYDAELRQSMPARIKRVAKGITEASGATCEVAYYFRYPSVSNHPEMTAMVKDVSMRVVGESRTIHHDVDLIGEDMAFFFEKVPGCYFFVGARNPVKDCAYPHHSPRFNFDEDAMPIAVEMMVQCVERYLGE
ncbi:MAG: amidohydrolase [bacterium]